MTDFEREDLELAAMMGGRFSDETNEPAVEPVAKPTAKKYSNPGKNTPAREKLTESLWQPVKPAADFTEKLKRTTKDVGLYAALSLILFWWQQSGRLDYTTAWWALLVCVGMVFFSIGKNFRGGVQQ